MKTNKKDTNVGSLYSFYIGSAWSDLEKEQIKRLLDKEAEDKARNELHMAACDLDWPTVKE